MEVCVEAHVRGGVRGDAAAAEWRRLEWRLSGGGAVRLAED